MDIVLSPVRQRRRIQAQHNPRTTKHPLIPLSAVPTHYSNRRRDNVFKRNLERLHKWYGLKRVPLGEAGWVMSLRRIQVRCDRISPIHAASSSKLHDIDASATSNTVT